MLYAFKIKRRLAKTFLLLSAVRHTVVQLSSSLDNFCSKCPVECIPEEWQTTVNSRI